MAPVSEPSVILDRLTRGEMAAFIRARVPHSARTHSPQQPGPWPRNAYVALRSRDLEPAFAALGWIAVHLDRRDPQVWIARKERRHS